MKPSQLAFLDKFYEFAEKCDDDYDVMCQAIKLTGCKRRPNIIKRHIEGIGVDAPFMPYYDDMIDKITENMILQAHKMVRRERGLKAWYQPSLF